MTEDAVEGAESSAWEVQLHELNVRSHQYTNRLWQLPFAYAALAVLAFGLENVPDRLVGSVAGILGVIGVIVVFHMLFGLADGVRRAVDGIREAEEHLNLPVTAKWKPAWYVVPMAGIVLLIAVAELVYAACRWC